MSTALRIQIGKIWRKTMTELVLASNNKKKIAELTTLLSGISGNLITVRSLRDIGFTGDIDETGTTFEENSLIKANTPAALGYIGIADDSGLAVDHLDGAPGIYSARYASLNGENASDEANRNKLVRELCGVPEQERTARFVCTAAIVLPENSEYVIPEKWRISDELARKTGISASRAMVVRGECHGIILDHEIGDGGFGYDPLFYYKEFGKTFAELDADEKNKVSHRGNAMREFTARLSEIFG